MQRWYSRMLLALIALSAVLYVADWTVLRTRGGGDSAHGLIVVNNSYVIHQKNGKMEYLYDPPLSTPCVRTLFPHQSQSACWWLARHTEQQKDITAN